jgi:ABC-type Fe3+ transport system substrate-binding protein
MPVSEILQAAGVDFAGGLPPEIQFVQVFSAAVVAGSRAIENSKRLIAFFLQRALPRQLGKAEWSRLRPRPSATPEQRRRITTSPAACGTVSR